MTDAVEIMSYLSEIMCAGALTIILIVTFAYNITRDAHTRTCLLFLITGSMTAGSLFILLGVIQAAKTITIPGIMMYVIPAVILIVLVPKHDIPEIPMAVTADLVVITEGYSR